ncbi:TPA: type I glyceraldehyde-3-phosphate dehydrogenase [Candidatus Acetothermia bacterium]|nr:type I glyceraldehyde-3-phosphate dehydrogenase [Candidatus Acetothermia bacterium]
MKKITINGFGRIGRAFLRAVKERDDLQVVAINDINLDPKTAAYMLKYDSVYGRYPGEVKPGEEGIIIDGKLLPLLNQPDPTKLPWKEHAVDVVIESTGVFYSFDKAALHLSAGAAKVLISAPAGGEGKEKIPQLVFGVNNDAYDRDLHSIVSAASCTTNSLAPIAMVLDREFGIEKGFLTTIHAYTAGQGLVDSPAKWKTIARGRAAAINIVPTTTGAATATAVVIPALKGKMDGIALRVPVPTGSVTDFVAKLSRTVTAGEVNEALQRYAIGELHGILATADVPLVSSDCIGDPHSSIVDLTSTRVVDNDLVKIIAFYDNEWGYANRLIDVARFL